MENTMASLVQAYLNGKRTEHWHEDETAVQLFRYLMQGSLYQENYHPHIKAIRRKKPKDLTLAETEIYLTALAKGDRLNEGLFDQSVQSGLLETLLKKWLDEKEGGNG